MKVLADQQHLSPGWNINYAVSERPSVQTFFGQGEEEEAEAEEEEEEEEEEV